LKITVKAFERHLKGIWNAVDMLLACYIIPVGSLLVPCRFPIGALGELISKELDFKKIGKMRVFRGIYLGKTGEAL
jgi:hypothetical protein